MVMIDKLTNIYDKMGVYKNKLIKENQILELNLYRISGNINRNNRMFDYENIEIQNILSSRYIVLFLYYSLFIIYIVFGNFQKVYNNNKKILFFIILYSTFPFLINYILYISYSDGDTCRGGTKAIDEESGQSVCRPSNYVKKDPIEYKKIYNMLADDLQEEINNYNSNHRSNVTNQKWDDWAWMQENDACYNMDCAIDYGWKARADDISKNLQHLA
jgi:hypothetical protein